jgi:hypothetical protein
VWSTFRWWLVVVAPSAVSAVGLLALQAFLTLLYGRPQAVLTGSPVTESLWGGGILITVAVMLLVARRRRPNPRNTTPFDEAVRHLKIARKKYCLLLRPFGHDGGSAMTFGGWPGVPMVFHLFMRPPRTLEQMATRAARNAAGLQTYALVDQEQLIATAGPVWLRTHNEHWESAIEYLIERAHSIVIVLHPRHALRHGFDAELQMIARKGLQGRVVIVWPAEATTSPRYDACHRHAARILTTLEGAAVDFTDPDSPQVAKWMRKLGAARALGVEIVARDDRNEEDRSISTRIIALDRSSRFYFLEPDPLFYRDAIHDAIARNNL